MNIMSTPTVNSAWPGKRRSSVARWALLLLVIVATSEATWAQSGPGQIVFVSYGDGDPGLFTMDADGSNQTRLTTGWKDGFPAWSPDGCRIAFKRYFSIFVMDADGSHQKLVCDVPRGNPAGLRRESLTPDGWRIFFEHGGIDTHCSDFRDRWSPDGSKFLGEDGRHGILVSGADGRASTRLASGHSPAWSPDGSKIAFVSSEKENPGVVVMNADGTNVTRLTDGYVGARPSWSPDGSKIAFETIGEGGISLEVMDADGTNRIKLADQLLFDMLDQYPVSWSPDGSRIVFTRDGIPLFESSERDVDISLDIYTVNADGSNLTRLTTGGRSLDPVWSPTARCESGP